MISFNKLFRQEGRLKDWLDTLENRLEKLASAYNAASFNKYIGRTAPDLNGLDAEISALLTNPTNRTNIEGWAERVSDPLLRRRLEIFELTILEAEVSKNLAISELRNVINERLLTFQPRVNGENFSRSDLLYILRNFPDRPYRQKVYQEGLTPLAQELDAPVRRLIQLRNAEAQRLGYQNYAELHLSLQGLSSEKLFALFAHLEKHTDQPYSDFLAQALDRNQLDRLEAWDILWLTEEQGDLTGDPFSHEKIVPQVYKLLEKLGLTAQKLPLELVTKDTPFGGLCFTIRVPDDIRIVASLKDGYPYLRTLVHEFGHALHATYNRQKSYLLKREWGIFNEGMAEVLAYFTHYPEWLVEAAGLSAAEAARYKQETTIRRIFRVRNLLAQAHFELEAYAQPEADFNLLLAQIEQRYLKIPLTLTPRWAASSFPTTHPLYRHNYILADLIAAQTHATLHQKFGSLFELNPSQQGELFNFLCENYYAPGAARDWKAKVEQATGQPLSAAAFIADCGLELKTPETPSLA